MPKTVDRNVQKRALAKLALDKKRFNEHPWYAIERGWVFTFDEKANPGVPAIRPMPQSRYLKEITELWLDNKLGLLEKSRQLMMSWLMCYLMAWDAWTKQARHNLLQGKRQEDASATGDKGLLGRARFMRNHLPPWLQPTVVGESTTYETYDNGSTLEAIPEGQNVIRSKVISNLFMDEIGFHETGEANWNAAVPAAQGGGRIWGVSTPNGHDFVYQSADAQLWDNWRKWPEVAPGIHSYINSSDVCLVALHYSADEQYESPEAQAQLRKGYTNMREYMRERELDFTLAAGLGVFAGEFDRGFHVIDKYEVQPGNSIYRGWDFGYNGQACSLAQFNNEGQLVWFDQVIEKAVPLPKIIQMVKEKTQRALAKTMQAQEIRSDISIASIQTPLFDYGDPSADQKNSKGETDRMLLSKHGIQLLTKVTKGRKKDLVDQVRQLLLPRSDGKPAMLIARNTEAMDHVIGGMAGGYHYKKPKPGVAETEEPHKDGWYDHLMDGFQYLVDNASPLNYGMPSGEADPDWWMEREPGVGNDPEPLGYH